MKVTETILDRIMVDVRHELHQARSVRSLPELSRMLPDAPPVRPMSDALRLGFGLIAEIKEKSPSHGTMRKENVEQASSAYERSSLVRAISVLTNGTHFGMSMERLRQVKVGGTKPVLRKDFIFDPYQVYEARAFGADAILLMANLLEPEEMKELYRVAQELGMDALFECHNREQIDQVPAGAKIYGINSRTFDARKNVMGVGLYGLSKALGQFGAGKDLTVDESRFALGKHLPPDAIKVAESGVHPHTLASVRAQGYDCALVGTSLLSASHGVQRELELFEQALVQAGAPTPKAT